jgi:LPXTG-motif cell wall-anchored protein
MKTTNVILVVGATVLVGGGAYLFLKNKNKKDAIKLAELGGATSGGITPSVTTTTANLTPAQVDVIKNNIASGSTTTPSGIVLTTPEQVAQVVSLANQVNRANEIAREIRVLTLKKVGTFAFGNNYSMSSASQINMQITQLRDELKNLGYKEVNGKAVKLV